MTEDYKTLQEESYDPSSQWRKKEPTSFKDIVLRAMEACRLAWSADLRIGGTYMTPTSKGVLPVYYPDQREVNINTTLTLYDLMVHYFDEEANKNIDTLSEELDKIPEGHKLQVTKFRKQFGPKFAKQADEKAEQWMQNETLELHRQLFRELVLLFKRKNEFEAKRTAGAY